MNKGKILVLEDELLIGTDLTELITDEGYEVVLALSKKEAIDIVKNGFVPQLALCDINLGEAHEGLIFAKWLKQGYNTEVIYITAFSSKEIIEKSAPTEPLNFIVKPWSEEQIKVTIKIAFNYIQSEVLNNNLLSMLSITECRIINLIAKNNSSKLIAKLLFISEKTVRNHRYNISKKMNLPNEKNNLLKWAMQNL